MLRSPLVFLTAVALIAPGLLLADELQMQWSRQFPARQVAWQHTQRMPIDKAYVPGAAGDIVVVGCEHNGAAIALSAADGEERWQYFTSGPIRVGPVVDERRVYVASDDGYLHCLDHGGKLLWKFRGGPADRWVIGHDRLISAWPAAARPVLHEKTIYYQAGYWPVDGVYVHALDAETGEVRWSSISLPLRPTGELRIDGEKLVVDSTSGSAVLLLTDGSVLNEKPPKPTPPVLPDTPGIKGSAVSKLQAGDNLLVATDAGLLYGFAKRNAQPAEHIRENKPLDLASSAATKKLLEQVGGLQGYCLVAGIGDGSLVTELLRGTSLHVVALDDDAQRIDIVRKRLESAGLFDSHRLSVVQADPASVDLPPYFASLVVATSPVAPENLQRVLRPFGGKLAQLRGGEFQISERSGPPPGSDNWPQEFQDAANTLASHDKLVKAPLGLLWYGGEAADTRFYYDGHVDHQSGHGLNPQPVSAEIVDGRMILQGPGLLGAIDVYTGRVLWESPLPKVYTFGGAGGGLGVHSKKHPQPWEYPEALEAEVPATHRCRASGFNMVSTPEGVYVAADQHILRIDLESGKVLSRFEIPAELARDETLCWGGLREDDGVLLATLFRPQDLIDAQAGHDGNGGDWAGDRMPMSHLVALNRRDGKLLWSRAADWGFVNRSGYCAGGGRVYCVDLMQPEIMEKFLEADRKLPASPPMLYALDLKTGEELWNFELDVMAQNLAYAAHRDWLLVPNRNLRVWEGGKWVDKSSDIRRGISDKNRSGKMRALSAADGRVMWEVSESPYHTPLIVLDDLLIDRYGTPFNLTDGQRNERIDPLTGAGEAWSFRKAGCNHLVACDNLVTWRCAFYDLASGSGVVKLTGMDAGCTPTLLPACGVLNVPNFGTHHKRNRMTAMALVHRPSNELWTRYTEAAPETAKPIIRGGYNFGAPGDRVAADGTVWLAVDPRKRENVQFEPNDATWFQQPLSQTDSFVAASGVVGATKLAVPVLFGKKLKPDGSRRRYEVRLHFAEPQRISEGKRVFDVQLEGETMLKKFDIVKEAQGANRPVIKSFEIDVTDTLDIVLSASVGTPLICGVEFLAK